MCVQEIVVEWTKDGYGESLYPRIKAEGGALKMLALFPEILSLFFGMVNGGLVPSEFVSGLVQLGVLPSSK